MIVRPFPVVLDANVLVPPTLSDILLRLAEDPALVRPRWTIEILQEVRNSQLKLGWDSAVAEKWHLAVTQAFPEAMVTGHKVHLTQCSNSINDRHVLAAAIRTGCDTIVTNNLKHFPARALEPHSVRAISPEEFLMDLAVLCPDAVRGRLRKAAFDRGREVPDLIAHFNRYMPDFAAKMSDLFSVE